MRLYKRNICTVEIPGRKGENICKLSNWPKIGNQNTSGAQEVHQRKSKQSMKNWAENIKSHFSKEKKIEMAKRQYE